MLTAHLESVLDPMIGEHNREGSVLDPVVSRIIFLILLYLDLRRDPGSTGVELLSSD